MSEATIWLINLILVSACLAIDIALGIANGFQPVIIGSSVFVTALWLYGFVKVIRA